MAQKRVRPYCNFCGKQTWTLVKTHDDKDICMSCAKTEGLCEICGSIREFVGQTADEQTHYDELCFK